MWELEWAAIWIAWWLSFAVILDYFSISHEWLIVMSAMLLLDWIFWIIAAKVRWEAITSKKWGEGLIRKLSRWTIPFLVSWWLSRTWMDWIEELNLAILWMIVFSETYSIIRHVYSINYKEELPELDSLKLLLNWIAKLFKGMVHKADKEITKDDTTKEE